MSKSKEKRAANRYPTIGIVEFDTGTGVTTRLSPTGVAVTTDIEFESGTGDVFNLSTTGICFTTDKAVELGAMLRCAIFMQKGRLINLRCEGRVVRVDRFENRWQVAISFTTFEW